MKTKKYKQFKINSKYTLGVSGMLLKVKNKTATILFNEICPAQPPNSCQPLVYKKLQPFAL